MEPRSFTNAEVTAISEDLTHPQYACLLFEQPCMVGHWSPTPRHPLLTRELFPRLVLELVATSLLLVIV